MPSPVQGTRPASLLFDVIPLRICPRHSYAQSYAKRGGAGMWIASAEEFIALWRRCEDFPEFPEFDIPSGQVLLDMLDQYPDCDCVLVKYFVSPTVLARPAHGPHADVRARVANARRILPSTFARLAKGASPRVSRYIAINVKCPVICCGSWPMMPMNSWPAPRRKSWRKKLENRRPGRLKTGFNHPVDEMPWHRHFACLLYLPFTPLARR